MYILFSLPLVWQFSGVVIAVFLTWMRITSILFIMIGLVVTGFCTIVKS